MNKKLLTYAFIISLSNYPLLSKPHKPFWESHNRSSHIGHEIIQKERFTQKTEDARQRQLQKTKSYTQLPSPINQQAPIPGSPKYAQIKNLQ